MFFEAQRRGGGRGLGMLEQAWANEHDGLSVDV